MTTTRRLTHAECQCLLIAQRMLRDELSEKQASVKRKFRASLRFWTHLNLKPNKGKVLSGQVLISFIDSTLSFAFDVLVLPLKWSFYGYQSLNLRSAYRNELTRLALAMNNEVQAGNNFRWLWEQYAPSDRYIPSRMPLILHWLAALYGSANNEKGQELQAKIERARLAEVMSHLRSIEDENSIRIHVGNPISLALRYIDSDFPPYFADADSEP